jgi:ParB-like chromosome segregation protein Spo0J
MNEKMMQVALDLIDPNPWQVRLAEDPEVVTTIANSIEVNGLLQMPTARTAGERYQLAFGHTRLAAFKLLRDGPPAQMREGAALRVPPDSPESTVDPGGRKRWDSMPLIVRELTDLQMFEMAVAENIKRKDLNPIEQARAMQTYLEKFNKTSEEAGQFFGVSAETVRGTVRLLKLPEPIQEKVRTGTVSVGAARKILTVQRIDPGVVKGIQKEVVRYEEPDNQSVERLLDNALRQSKTTISMWRDHMGGEPCGGSGLWPLSWQHKGSLEKLPMPFILQILGKKYSEAEAVRKIMGTVDAGAALDAKELKLDPEAVERVNHLANPPVCLACPFHAKMDDAHYCGMPECWKRKREAWMRKEFDRLIEKLGIPAYDPAADGTKVVAWENDWEAPSRTFKEALSHKTAKEHAGLRLQIRHEAHYSKMPGTDHQLIQIIDVAGTLKAKRSSQVSASNPYAGKQAKVKVTEKFVREVAGPLMAPAFAGIKNLQVLMVLSRSARLGKPDLKGMTEAAKRRYLQTELARHVLLDGSTSLGYPSPYAESAWTRGPVEMAKRLQVLAKDWGVRLPPGFMAQARAQMPQKAAAKKKGKKK